MEGRFRRKDFLSGAGWRKAANNSRIFLKYKHKSGRLEMPHISAKVSCVRTKNGGLTFGGAGGCREKTLPAENYNAASAEGFCEAWA